jgi:hypothetical protein
MIRGLNAIIRLAEMMKRGFTKTPTNEVVYGRPSHHFFQLIFFFSNKIHVIVKIVNFLLILLFLIIFAFLNRTF